MKNSLQVYVNEQFGKIRGVMIDGVPYFVGKDVAKALGYTNPQKAIRDHVDKEDKTVNESFTVGKKQAPVLINESGLYSLILTSKLPQAKEFKRWVTSEVLPSIRETGMYVSDKAYQKWLETRQHGKETRKLETSVIKQYIAYARAQGDTRPEGLIYAAVTIPCNLAVGLPKKNGRDSATTYQLNCLDLIEGSIHNVITNGMADGLHYTQIEARVHRWINDFLAMIFHNQNLLK